MNKEAIINSISNTYSKLSSECQSDLLKITKILSFEKGKTLVREGQYSNKTYYIVSGAARAYYLKNGKDISDWFAFENDFISPIISYFTDKASPHYIELLEDSILLELTKENVEIISNKHHDFERLIRVIVTKTMLSLQERISSILFQKAEQRYKQLLETYPTIIQRVSLTHIASYLGITLETLSRIRKPKKRI
ncbi:Crp/Fnr family transcriptional regulator [Tenacibaculum ascidiaceicola]|jgi:CRP-like cAMP-binding protein|uniref:Crp/Fnr family transcriptional regulator n=1 Tax=Tenacibaculum ascidiaceicola TaxID=1699411 RepID=UPI0039EC7D53